MTKRGEITNIDDDLEVQNFSDSEEIDGNDDEEVIYPSVKPEFLRKDTELFKSTLPIRVESTDNDDIPEVRNRNCFIYSHLLSHHFCCILSFRILFQVRWCSFFYEPSERYVSLVLY